MPKILLIQFRLQEKAATMEMVSVSRELGSDIELACISALENNLPWAEPEILLRSYRGVIFGGSGDFDFDGGRSADDNAKQMSYELLKQLNPLLKYIFKNDIPTLGICYGHQIIGAFAGAQIVNDQDQKKSGSHKVELLVDREDYSIFFDLPETFYAHYVHKDSLASLPMGATLLMKGGEGCKYSALNYKNNIFTTQFHPELTVDDMKLRIDAYPHYLPDGVTVEDIFKNDNQSNKILQNFGQYIINQIEKN